MLHCAGATRGGAGNGVIVEWPQGCCKLLRSPLSVAHVKLVFSKAECVHI